MRYEKTPGDEKMTTTLRRTLAVSLSLCLALGCGGLQGAPAVEAGSEFPPITETESVVAVAKATGKRDGPQSEAAALLDAVKRAPNGAPSVDRICIALAMHPARTPQMRSDMLAACDAPQLARLVKTAGEQRAFPAQVTFGDEYLRRQGLRDAEAAEVCNAAAMAHMVADPDNREASELWGRAANQNFDKNQQMVGQIYLEAVTKPNSIAAVEAAHQIGMLQAKHGANPFKKRFSDWRIAAAADQPFFRDYVTNPSATPRDRAALLYVVMCHADGARDFKKVRDLAAEIFALTGYEGRAAERTAYGVAVSYARTMECAEAARQFEAFVRAYPNSPDAPDACLECARSHERAGHLEDALAYYEAATVLFPGTTAAKQAQKARTALTVTSRVAAEFAVAPEAGQKALATLRKSLDPSSVWASAPSRGTAKVFAAAGTADSATTGGVLVAASALDGASTVPAATAASHRRHFDQFTRLSSLLPSASVASVSAN